MNTTQTAYRPAFLIVSAACFVLGLATIILHGELESFASAWMPVRYAKALMAAIALLGFAGGVYLHNGTRHCRSDYMTDGDLRFLAIALLILGSIQTIRLLV